MRPVAIGRVIETCKIAVKAKSLETNDLAHLMNISSARANEILHELTKMKLLSRVGPKKFYSNKNTGLIVSCAESSSWNELDEYLYRNYDPYRVFIDLLRDNSARNQESTVEELALKHKKIRSGLNLVSVQVLSEWCERLNIIQKNIYSGKIYYINKISPSEEHFDAILRECYDSLNIDRGLGIKLVYVSIPQIRECTCDKLRMSRDLFNNFLRSLYLTNSTQFELSGAPFTSTARKSRLTEKIYSPNKSESLKGSPSSLKASELGLDVNERIYYFMAIHK